MAYEQITAIDILIETHIELDRLGPGSEDATRKALSFIENLDQIKRVADMGCGTGGQTFHLAKHLVASIVGIDIFPAFIDVFNANAQKLNLEKRVTGMVGSMDDLSFQKEEFDLIWSEGAIDAIGFEKGINYWEGFLKCGGYLAVTSPTWLSAEHPAQVEKFWADAGSRLDTIEHNISIMQKAGYHFTAAFALSKECWTDNYFALRSAKERELLKKYPGSTVVEECVRHSQYEIELYAEHGQHYGYVFYLGQKM